MWMYVCMCGGARMGISSVVFFFSFLFSFFSFFFSFCKRGFSWFHFSFSFSYSFFHPLSLSIYFLSRLKAISTLHYTYIHPSHLMCVERSAKFLVWLQIPKKPFPPSVSIVELLLTNLCRLDCWAPRCYYCMNGSCALSNCPLELSWG